MMGRARSLALLNATDVAAAIECETILPVGTISYFPDASIPAGWLSANGQAVSRATYAALFAKIGTTYGAGNGTTTFNLPDGRGRTLIGSGQGTGLTNRALGATGGAEAHQLTIPEMPAHTHTFGTSGSGGGGISSGGQSAPQNTSSVGSGNAHNNMQPFMSANMCIYAGA